MSSPNQPSSSRRPVADPSDTAEAPATKAAERVRTAIENLREMAFWQERAREPARRPMAYRAAADALEQLDAQDVLLLHEQSAIQSIRGIGPSTAEVITAALDGRVSPKLTALRTDAPLAASNLLGRLRGDLHTHTDWSDGGAPLDQMARTAAALGRQYLAITDHSPRLRVANGLSAERLAEQQQVITRTQSELDADGIDLRILRGIEVDILDTGALDQTSDALGQLDIVVASVHSKLRMEAPAMTRRMVAAIANPATTVLGHCTGRLVTGERGQRPASQFDAEVVFQACIEFNVAVEINARPERADPPDDLLALAAEMGCLFSIDSDAHAPGQLDFLAHGAARAEAAGIEPDRIITTWPCERVLEFASGRCCWARAAGHGLLVTGGWS